MRRSKKEASSGGSAGCLDGGVGSSGRVRLYKSEDGRVRDALPTSPHSHQSMPPSLTLAGEELEEVAKVVAGVKGDPADVVHQDQPRRHHQLPEAEHVDAVPLCVFFGESCVCVEGRCNQGSIQFITVPVCVCGAYIHGMHACRCRRHACARHLVLGEVDARVLEQLDRVLRVDVVPGSCYWYVIGIFGRGE